MRLRYIALASVGGLILLGIVCLVGSRFLHVSPASAVPYPSGARVRIAMDGVDVAPFARNEATLDAFIEVAITGDRYGLREIPEKDLAFVDNGTLALVLERKGSLLSRPFLRYRVRILEGPLTGQAGWVLWNTVLPP
jgi:hypothetical protein